ncbi:MAG: hypothetical protein H6537_02115 [Bacteroidales bacterium]|nr:hypothetical protein [Bacteroidales bacterium]HPD95546.1 hypothetical protein [Tenuifilaceae bacterium]HRX32128.1 hypothetical protein [Tenuifilaceae bacterium]
MKKTLLLGFAALAFAVTFTSCGKVPQEKIDAANAAIDTAKMVEADVYLASDFTAVQDSMNAVMAGVEAQKSKLFKKFGPASEKLDAILLQARQLKVNAIAKKDEVKKEVEALTTETDSLMAVNATLLKKAPRGKEGAAVLEQIKTELDAINATITEAKTMYTNGKYMDALNKLNAAKDSATKINTELNDAIAKVKGKR